jgi:hypothetical protein
MQNLGNLAFGYLIIGILIFLMGSPTYLINTNSVTNNQEKKLW